MNPDNVILIAGTGSIGRRHLQNLRALGWKNFVLYRSGKSTLPENDINGIPQESDLKKALAHKPVAAIIANPTAFHLPVAVEAAKAGSNLFIEKPVSHTLYGLDQLQKLAKAQGLIIQTGFQFRFHPQLLRIKHRLENKEIGEIVSVQVHWGEYLPDWHPWEDYRKSYSARKELGGGVLLTLCHPFDYLRFLFGDVKEVSAVQSDKGLGLDVEDTADVLLRFKSGFLGNVHLNYLQRPPEHFIRIIGQNGIIQLDFLRSQGTRNNMFLSEMRHFLSSIKEKKEPKCTLEDGIKALKIVLAAKKSALKKQMIQL